MASAAVGMGEGKSLAEAELVKMQPNVAKCLLGQGDARCIHRGYAPVGLPATCTACDPPGLHPAWRAAGIPRLPERPW